MVRKEIDVNKPLTDAQIAMLQALADRPDEPDADCPELTEVQLSQFRRRTKARRTPETNRYAAAIPAGFEKSKIPWQRVYLRS